jgi:hypothetical protein
MEDCRERFDLVEEVIFLLFMSNGVHRKILTKDMRSENLGGC